MRPRIAFGIQSAVHRADTLQQLVSALDGHSVVIHHDFSQQPDFVVTGPNVSFVEEPARTGWADWGLIEGIRKTIEHCLQHGDFDYFQLLSPVDLPIRPLSEFEDYVTASGLAFNCDTVAMDSDEMAFQGFAYRAYAVQGSVPYRILWRLCRAYFGGEPETESRAGLAIPVLGRSAANGRLLPSARAAGDLTHWLVRRMQRRDPKLERYPLNIGGMWFGASHAGCVRLIEMLRDDAFIARFREYFCAGEMLFNTAVAMSGLPYGPGNHSISHYVGARPQWIGIEDFDELEASGKFFARKFPDQPDAPARLRMLERIGVRPGREVREGRQSGVTPLPVAEPGDAVSSAACAMPDTGAESVGAQSLITSSSHARGAQASVPDSYTPSAQLDSKVTQSIFLAR